MSLDLLVCKVVQPKDANNTYPVTNSWDYPSLRRIQKTGYVCVKEYRLEANCLSQKWYDKFYQTGKSDWDTQKQAEEREFALSDMRIIFPDQIEEKLIKWIPKKKFKKLIEQILKLAKTKEVDFFYICW
jgi:hypothetical protein